MSLSDIAPSYRRHPDCTYCDVMHAEASKNLNERVATLEQLNVTRARLITEQGKVALLREAVVRALAIEESSTMTLWRELRLGYDELLRIALARTA